jgi:hypothetical protein
MTDHAKDIEEIALIGEESFSISGWCVLRLAAAELRRLQKLVNDCSPYLADGETPAQALLNFKLRMDGPEKIKYSDWKYGRADKLK